jgi:hypothetical protein
MRTRVTTAAPPKRKLKHCQAEQEQCGQNKETTDAVGFIVLGSSHPLVWLSSNLEAECKTSELLRLRSHQANTNGGSPKHTRAETRSVRQCEEPSQPGDCAHISWDDSGAVLGRHLQQRLYFQSCWTARGTPELLLADTTTRACAHRDVQRPRKEAPGSVLAGGYVARYALSLTLRNKERLSSKCLYSSPVPREGSKWITTLSEGL